MRPIRDYHLLSIPDLEDEFTTVADLLFKSIEMLGKFKTTHHCDNLSYYYQADADSHAAKQRMADYNTQNQFSDVIEFEQQVAAYRLSYETLVAIISWRRSSYGEEASRLQSSLS
jgi:hypothetical protein